MMSQNSPLQSIKPSFLKKLIKPVKKELNYIAKKTHADKRFKFCFAVPHFLILMGFQLTKGSSLREIVASLGLGSKIKHLLGIKRDFKRSTLSDANNNQQRLEFFQEAFAAVFKKLSPHIGGRHKVFAKVKAIDGTLFKCVASMIWAEYRETAKACKGHLLWNLRHGLPEKIELTDGNYSERAVLRKIIKKGFTYLFDRGYNSYKLFMEFEERGAYFVTRLLKNAVYEIITHRHVSEADRLDGVMSDQTILFPEEELVLRLVTYKAEDGHIYRFLTNRFDLQASTVAMLYRKRWEIEEFFRFLKRFLNNTKFIGRSREAVLIQLYSAMITFILLMFYFSTKMNIRKLNIKILRLVREVLFKNITEQFMENLLISDGCKV